MQNDVIILGAGGHAKVIADIVLKCGDNLLGYLDDHTEEPWLGFPVLGRISDAAAWVTKAKIIIGIGNNVTRYEVANRFSDESLINWYTAIHPTAVIAADVKIGSGTAIMANAVINPSTEIGRHCIINTSAVVEHDTVIGDFTHLSPNATSCGTVTIGNFVHIGAGAIIKNNTHICNDAIVGAGGVVVRDISEVGTYIGIPARRIF